MPLDVVPLTLHSSSNDAQFDKYLLTLHSMISWLPQQGHRDALQAH